MTVIETVQHRTPLGVALHDLLTDAPITDGLVVSARPTTSRGRFRHASVTPRGVHLVSNIPGLREFEFPRSQPSDVDFDAGGLPSGAAVDVDVLVEDRLRRFLPTVLQLVAPQRGIATALDALAPCSTLAWSIPDDTPMFLMSSPGRSIPPATAVVRACLRHHTTMEPAAHAVLVVDTRQDGHRVPAACDRDMGRPWTASSAISFAGVVGTATVDPSLTKRKPPKR